MPIRPLASGARKVYPEGAERSTVGGPNDLNGDGRVDVGDFVILKQGLGSRLGAAIGAGRPPFAWAVP